MFFFASLFKSKNLTFLRFWIRLVRKICLFERPPFEVLLIAAASDISFLTLLASRFGFITFEPFRLAGNAAWIIGSAQILLYVLRSHKRVTLPLRLFDNLGLLTPAAVLAVTGPVDDLVGAAVVRFGAGLVEAMGGDFVVVEDGGLSRIAEGEGI